jgi:sec-independent protein translocase protein TatB
MFDIGAFELLVVAVVAILVIGPKDLPLALRTAGRWIGKIRRVSSHFRTGLDAMVREAEMEDLDRKWRERNEAIMAAHPADEPMEPLPQAVPSEGDAALSAAEARLAHERSEVDTDADEGEAAGKRSTAAPPSDMKG